MSKPCSLAIAKSFQRFTGAPEAIFMCSWGSHFYQEHVISLHKLSSQDPPPVRVNTSPAFPGVTSCDGSRQTVEKHCFSWVDFPEARSPAAPVHVHAHRENSPRRPEKSETRTDRWRGLLAEAGTNRSRGSKLSRIRGWRGDVTAGVLICRWVGHENPVVARLLKALGLGSNLPFLETCVNSCAWRGFLSRRSWGFLRCPTFLMELANGASGLAGWIRHRLRLTHCF